MMRCVMTVFVAVRNATNAHSGLALPRPPFGLHSPQGVQLETVVHQSFGELIIDPFGPLNCKKRQTCSTWRRRHAWVGDRRED